MAAAAPDARREKIVEHLFRALTDINAEGNAVRRPQTLAELVAVTGSDEPTLREIIDRFRADGVSFLRPYGDEPIDPRNEIDISHEALIRCWRKIADKEEGWLRREFQDGLIWQSLRMQADKFANDKEETLSSASTIDRDAWLGRSHRRMVPALRGWAMSTADDASRRQWEAVRELDAGEPRGPRGRLSQQGRYGAGGV